MQSRRNYVTIEEVQNYANVSISDNTEGYERITIAEELIDAYVQFQKPFVDCIYTGTATSGTTTTLTDNSTNTNLDFDNDYFIYCQIQIIGGTNKGQIRNIISSDKNTKTINVDTAFTSPIDITSVYKIFQLGKFPRSEDVETVDGNGTYYKTIPEAVKNATLAQMEYMIQKGDGYFVDGVNFKSETIGDYSYTKGDTKNSDNLETLVAPKAKLYLLNYIHRTGKIII